MKTLAKNATEFLARIILVALVLALSITLISLELVNRADANAMPSKLHGHEHYVPKPLHLDQQ